MPPVMTADDHDDLHPRDEAGRNGGQESAGHPRMKGGSRAIPCLWGPVGKSLRKLILDIGGGKVYTTLAFRFGFGCFPYPRACNKRLLGFFAPEGWKAQGGR